jgi:DNA adenine methylase
VKPLISYYGGKQRIASKILPYFPPHKVYVEPFAGGAALLFAKPVPQHDNKENCIEVINDKDELLINLYRVVRERPLEFSHYLELTPHSDM